MTTTQKTCFVVMGFGEKTDFQTQRVLDLDKTYRVIIKRAVEDAGLKCIRADDVIHSGIIDKPMYELLLNADLVVADLSTSNANAIYELGVRHALRPNTTIVIAESEFKFPFDLKGLLIRKYQHLGKGIDAEEAERVRVDLGAAIRTLIEGSDPDSPVYTFLPQLQRPLLSQGTTASAKSPRGVLLDSADNIANTTLLEAARTARKRSDFVSAQALFSKLRERQPNDPYVIQQLAFATYMSNLPTPLDALLKAHEILQALKPRATQDTETLGLWGAIHKRLWEMRQQRADLDEAIWAYERGFYLRNDHYTGINYAFLLNVRAAISMWADATTDFVTAQRIRRRVIEVCTTSDQMAVLDDAGRAENEDAFWRLATLIEAHVGIGEQATADELLKQATATSPEPWMIGTLQNQLSKLRLLLQTQAPLVATISDDGSNSRLESLKLFFQEASNDSHPL